MSDTTKIQWADSTFSPWRGCRKISPGCANCYIYGTTPLRVAGQKSGSKRIRASVSTWKQPLRWHAQTADGQRIALGRPNKRPKIFPSLCDWLDDEVPIEWLADFLKLIYHTPNLDWLLLTKRPENWKPRLALVTSKCATTIRSLDFITAWLNGCAPDNVWMGTSVENQEMADKRIPELLKIPAKIRFLSAEPLLGQINFMEWFGDHDYRPLFRGAIHWVIFGGESGPNARPCNVEWIWDGLSQCRAADIPAFVKQLGSRPFLNGQPADPKKRFHCEGRWDGAVFYPGLEDKKGGDPAEWPADLRVREFP